MYGGGGKNTAAGALFCINGKSNLYKQPFSNHLPNTFPSSLSILFVNPRGPLSKFFKYSCNKESEILQKSTKSVILYWAYKAGTNLQKQVLNPKFNFQCNKSTVKVYNIM